METPRRVGKRSTDSVARRRRKSAHLEQKQPRLMVKDAAVLLVAPEG